MVSQETKALVKAPWNLAALAVFVASICAIIGAEVNLGIRIGFGIKVMGAVLWGLAFIKSVRCKYEYPNLPGLAFVMTLTVLIMLEQALAGVVFWLLIGVILLCVSEYKDTAMINWIFFPEGKLVVREVWNTVVYLFLLVIVVTIACLVVDLSAWLIYHDTGVKAVSIQWRPWLLASGVFILAGTIMTYQVARHWQRAHTLKTA